MYNMVNWSMKHPRIHILLGKEINLINSFVPRSWRMLSVTGFPISQKKEKSKRSSRHFSTTAYIHYISTKPRLDHCSPPFCCLPPAWGGRSWAADRIQKILTLLTWFLWPVVNELLCNDLEEIQECPKNVIVSYVCGPLWCP